ncbi:hypothetical protein [Halopseudomonas pelagia]|uniref:hypothetical protein n=1 Tax=Halopseudomonas pelagia TaxID=553151 RepID=UPI0003B34CDC|nr:hypothetical protein [Halopseudomonas pelagia]
MPDISNVTLWVSIISPALVIIGWMVIFSNSNRIATRSEEYIIINKTIDKIMALDQRCAKYWLTADNRENANHWIAGTLSEIYGIRALLDILEAHHDFKNKDELLYQMRSAATLDAEKATELSTNKIKLKKTTQSLAFGSAMKSLYIHYRNKNS